jgi:Protein of unknown function (DUF1688)
MIDPDDDASVRYLRSARAVRERCGAVYAVASRGGLEHWAVEEDRLEDVARRVVQVTRAAYPDLAIPGHSRWRHFSAGGVDRTRALDERLAPLDEEERLAARFDLAIVSVLLDAGAGDRWRYRDAAGASYARSEGIAVASYDLFVAGAFSNDPTGSPLRADADALERVTGASLAEGLQVSDRNPMVGLEGRAALLQRLGRAVSSRPFGVSAGLRPDLSSRPFGVSAGLRPDLSSRPTSTWQGRLGGFGVRLKREATRGELPASEVLRAVLEGFSTIWPGRDVCAGQNLGDVWTHSALGRVPFHKLSQWLTYSLLEPLEWAGVRIVDQGALTGLAEYRNGGLFVDGGVLVPRHGGVLADEHDVSSDVVIEWRALTVALLDRVAERVRALLGLDATELSLAKVLEGGTWRAGRELAAEKRPGGGPPLRVRSDGTVF